MNGKELILHGRAKAALKTRIVQELELREIIAFLSDVERAGGSAENLPVSSRKVLYEAEEEQSGELRDVLWNQKSKR